MLEMDKYKVDLFALTLCLSTHILLLLSVIYLEIHSLDKNISAELGIVQLLCTQVRSTASKTEGTSGFSRGRGGGGGGRRGGGGGPSLLLLLFFLCWRRGVGVDGNGCSRWSVAGGDDGELLMDAKKIVPTVAVC